jgi:hypothetical protein
MYITTYRQPGRAEKQRIEHKSADPLYALACELGGVRKITWLSAKKAEVEYLNGYSETLTDVSTRHYHRV